jgi:mono/diheme cytochrome c family protein
MTPENTNTPAPEAPEPQAGSSSLPMAFVVLLALLGYRGSLSVDASGGGFRADVYPPYRSSAEVFVPPKEGDEEFNLGRTLYGSTCAQCHQASGSGTAGQFPPLAGSDWVTAEGPNRLIRVVLNGLKGPISISGSAFSAPAEMNPWKDTFKDGDIAAILTFIRRNKDWGHNASKVTAEQVAAIRKLTADRPVAWTGPELEKVPVKD